jgi:hypothetical protein
MEIKKNIPIPEIDYKQTKNPLHIEMSETMDKLQKGDCFDVDYTNKNYSYFTKIKMEFKDSYQKFESRKVTVDNKVILRIWRIT